MNPITRVNSDRTDARGLGDSNADICFFALCDSSGVPSVRTLVLRESSEQGFTLFINKTSNKWRIIQDNPAASLLLWYPSLQRQYRVTGTVLELNRSEIEANWPKRPTGSKYLDHAYGTFQNQSGEIESHEALVSHINQFKVNNPADDLTTPETATGIRLVPSQMEILDLNDAGRIHHRQLFVLEEDSWRKAQLMP